ncbi:MAG: SurA N-terminal domain-containing protein [Deltaproteobacteria bacterium]|jgi:hypothetical protein|nr:SurA N-terminal domain-containing protein [Deltaproteobacteria bacterium]
MPDPLPGKEPFLISKRFKNLVLTPLLLAVLLGLAIVAFQHFYRRQLWDPSTIALVNGRPVPTSALEEIVSLGYLQPLSDKEGGGQVIDGILDRLIDEELIRQAAEREGLVIDPAEVEANLAGYRDSFGCGQDPAPAVCQAAFGTSGESLAKAVEKQLLLRRMSDLVSRREWRLSGTEWRAFFRDWLAKYSFSSVFRVRVLLAQDSAESQRLLAAGLSRSRPGLEAMAERIREAGLEARVAGPLSLNLMAPETLRRFREANLGHELTQAMARPGKTTGPIKLDGSLAAFEVLEISKPVDPEELALAARREYERMAGERAFTLWLAKLREEATVKINPNLPHGGEGGNLADILRPKVPWEALTPWEPAGDAPQEGGQPNPWPAPHTEPPGSAP